MKNRLSVSGKAFRPMVTVDAGALRTLGLARAGSLVTTVIDTLVHLAGTSSLSVASRIRVQSGVFNVQLSTLGACGPAVTALFLCSFGTNVHESRKASFDTFVHHCRSAFIVSEYFDCSGIALRRVTSPNRGNLLDTNVFLHSRVVFISKFHGVTP